MNSWQGGIGQYPYVGTKISASTTTLKIIDKQKSKLNTLLPTYSPSGLKQLANASTVKGTTLGWGTYNTTSVLTVTSLVATPGVPFASVYLTSTGITTVPLTRAKQGLSSNLSTTKLLIVTPVATQLTLTNVNGWTGAAGTKLVTVTWTSVSCIWRKQASKTFLVCMHAFSHKPFNGLPVIGPGQNEFLLPE